ncbi:MAG: mycofactocin-coupled SDR family oxidoreductase, partial [Bifidobacteriaceae bacterium]|nr:mycofactocin-coupled SDR family oxidoreductase [Bifidobacteriaceae bacterium]
MASKVALVTGAARGIGQACALRLAEEGADVICLDIARPVESVDYPAPGVADLTATADGVRRLGRQSVEVQADVRDGTAMAAAVQAGADQLGGLDIVVAAAGIDSWNRAWELTDAQWDAMIGVNLTGVWQTAKAATPHLIARGGGAMVFVGSVLSHRANKDFAHYTAAKHGVLGLVRAFALELAEYRIRVNSIDPTVVRTGMVMNQAYNDRMIGHAGATMDEVIEHYLEWNAIPEPWIEPLDVANAVLFLASDEA